MLLLGLLEIVALARDSHALNSAALAAVGACAAGAGTDRVDATVDSHAGHLNAGSILRLYEQRPPGGAQAAWVALSNVGSFNTAPPGAEVRVTLRYPHRLITGRLFSGLLPNAQQGSLLVEATLTAKRQ